ncbi:DUF4105 domain-containing protein, partial [Escherichia coli]|uniref:lipoprotein N-acyltransferase Lnb domain-containing protein n=1 Tax=Escherichia coli TaxID=562 RepID=UPI000E762238
VWELKQVRFDYYFFDENCSFRLLELMEIARPGIELTEQFPLTAIPTDTVRLVRYRATGQARDSGIASRSYNLLRAINRNPPPDLQVERPGQPEDGHESRT